jgi:hypothetical protein
MDLIEAQIAPIGSPKEDAMRSNLLRVLVVTGGLSAVSAGCAGAGGDSAGPDAALGTADLIDDLEDGDDAIAATAGRTGNWYTFHDMTAAGTQMPPEAAFVPMAGGAGDSKFAAGTSGSGFTDWGAGMGFDLNSTETTRGTYDASKYKTLAFKAKGNVTVRVALETAAVTPTTDGGTCTASTVMGMECEDLHGTSIKLTGEWKEYAIPLSTLKQEGWGKPEAFDPKTAIGVLFSVDANVAFDFAVDDVSFYE